MLPVEKAVPQQGCLCIYFYTMHFTSLRETQLYYIRCEVLEAKLRLAKHTYLAQGTP